MHINDVKERKKERKKENKKKKKHNVCINNEVMNAVPAECLFYAKIMLQIGIEHFEIV